MEYDLTAPQIGDFDFGLSGLASAGGDIVTGLASGFDSVGKALNKAFTGYDEAESVATVYAGIDLVKQAQQQFAALQAAAEAREAAAAKAADAAAKKASNERVAAKNASSRVMMLQRGITDTLPAAPRTYAAPEPATRASAPPQEQTKTIPTWAMVLGGVVGAGALAGGAYAVFGKKKRR